ncbi:MAG: hypothetical protein IPJ07_09335 [Acidobacteria bacterium]|nr:hypothetical protein [Acidobacteriota bacterium]
MLIATRIIVQFIGQIFAVSLLRKNHPNLERPYKIWLYPLPSFLAFIGWVFVFATSGKEIILFSLGALALGISSYFIWSRKTGNGLSLLPNKYPKTSISQPNRANCNRLDYEPS